MYNFLLFRWIYGKIDEMGINNAVHKEYITQDEANSILATPQLIR